MQLTEVSFDCHNGVGVVIRSVEIYDLVKTAFWFHFSYYSLVYYQVKTRSSESQAEAEELDQSQSVGTCIVIGLSFRLCPTPTIWFSLDRKRRSHKRSRKKLEAFWFFRLRFRRAYDFAHDSDCDSVTSESQPLEHFSIALFTGGVIRVNFF